MEQRRQIPGELRVAGDGKRIVGKIPFNSVADIGGFRERLAPGCFTRSLRSGRKIVALWQHDSSKPLANTESGTLRFEDKADALYFEMDLDPESSSARDALISVRRKDVDRTSFGFTVKKNGERWDGDLRTIIDAELFEISPCTFAAYQESTLSVRNKNMKKQLRNEHGEIVMSQFEWEQQYAVNDDPPYQMVGESRSRVSVEDAPIYAGPNPLGRLMQDIATLSRGGNPGMEEARSRFDRMVKREKTLAEQRAAGTGGHVQGVASDGGFLVDGSSSLNLYTNGFNNSAILARTSQRDIGADQFVEMIGIDETSRETGSRGGGVRVYTTAELEQLTQSKTKFNKIRLEPKKLTGLFYCSNDLLRNASALEAEMTQLFTEEFAFTTQNQILNGNGVGEGLGILNAGALVTQAKEDAQGAATILFENLIAMKTRLLMKNRKNLLWVANQAVEAQLYSLALPVGTGGSAMQIYNPATDQSNGVAGTLMGIPISFVEQCSALGTVGDIVLADWSQYLVATKGPIEAASSIHLRFDFDQSCFRYVFYFDSQPRLASAITPFKGSDTVSPFVTLATRG